jgi:hypothetical protein
MKKIRQRKIPLNPDLGPLNDFKNFLYLVWAFLQLPPPTKLQYDIADYLQYADNEWSIIMAYRGTGKSYITAAFVVWLWMVDPQFKILVLSASEEKAKDFAFLVRQIIYGMDVCEHLRPGKDQRDSSLSFDVGPATASKDPSLNVYGIGGQITGGRAHFIIPDDVEIPGNSATVKQREDLLKKVRDIFAIIKGSTDEMKPQIKMLGTPQTQQSIYFSLLREGFDLRVWPSNYPAKVAQYKGYLAPMLVNDLEKNPGLVGKPTNPTMHDAEDLAKRAKGKQAWYQLQYMLDPSLSDEEKYPLKLKNMLVMHVDPKQGPIHMAWAEDPRLMVTDPNFPVAGLNGDRWYRPWRVSETWKPYQRRILAIDPAGGNDETAYVVLYYLMGYIFIAKWGAFKGLSKSVFEGLAKVAKDHECDTVLVERNFGAGKNHETGEQTSTFAELLKPYVHKTSKAAVEVIHSTGQKEVRICDTLEPVLADHRLVICDTVVKTDYDEQPEDAELQGLWQMTHLTRLRGALTKDDKVDALALGVGYFARMVAEDVEANEERHLEEARERSYQRFMAAAGASTSKADREGSWLSLDGDSEGKTNHHWEVDEEDTPWWIVQ